MLSLPARRAGGITTLALALALGAGCGLLAVANVERIGPLAAPGLSIVTTLPLAAYLAAALALVVAVLVGRHAWMGLALFFAWLPFEDLVRKYAGNDLRVYALKDLFFVLALVGLAPRLLGDGRWRRTLGSAWMPTMLVLVFAALLCIPSLLSDPRVPIVGMKLRFGYMPLLAVGAYLAADERRLRRTIVLLSLLGAAVCVIGLLQVFLGETFLAPTRATPNLRLNLVRGDLDNPVLRPTGPFVDAGRFASMTVISLTLGLALVRLAVTSRERKIGYVTAGIALAAAFASGGRAPFIFALLIAAFGLVFSNPRGAGHRRSAVIIVAVVLSATTAFFALQAAAPEATENRFEYYGDSLLPTSESEDVGGRLSYYSNEALKGIRLGGLVGHGTGTAAIGQQYYDAQSTVTDKAESGWGAIALEWGVIGLAVWVFWTAVWCRRAFRAAVAARSTYLRTAGVPMAIFLALNLTIGFTVGIQSFENYLTNAFLWLFSGILFGALVLAEHRDDQVEASPYGLPASS